MPAGVDVQVGSRVEVVFGGRSVRGLVVATSTDTDVPDRRLRELQRVLGPHAWMTPAELELARWAGRRFCAPVADVVRHALPDRVVAVEEQAADQGWFPPGVADNGRPGSGPERGEGSLPAGWRSYGDEGGALHEAVGGGGRGSWYWRPLPGEQTGRRLVELVDACLAGGRDAVVVVPGPRAAAADAVAEAFPEQTVDLRSPVTDRDRYRLWLRARCGRARVVVGERGGVWLPVGRLGLSVVVEEASPALKERRSPRHHAREVALERARRAGAVGLLVGLVPSAPAWRLLETERLRTVRAPRGREREAAPVVRVADQRGRVRTRLLRESMAALREATATGRYGVVLAARRGEGRALVCRDCGERVVCRECGAGVDAVQGTGTGSAEPLRLACARCGWRSGRDVRCRACGNRRLVPLAAGTRRLAAELRRSIEAPVASLEGYAAPAPPEPAVLVMTRGSALDAPPGDVGAVVLPDLDGQVRRPHLDAAEDALRLAMQVADWTVHGPGPPGRVVVQTRDATDRVVQALVRWDPGGFWRRERGARTELRFPPAAAAVRVVVAEEAADDLEARLREQLPAGDEVLGPVSDQGRASFLLKCDDRQASVDALAGVRRELSASGNDLWVDVDPVEVS